MPKVSQAALRHKHPEACKEDIVFLYDNARPHMGRQIKDQLACFGWKIFGHGTYSPDLVPSNFFSSAKEITW